MRSCCSALILLAPLSACASGTPAPICDVQQRPEVFVGRLVEGEVAISSSGEHGALIEGHCAQMGGLGLGNPLNKAVGDKLSLLQEIVSKQPTWLPNGRIIVGRLTGRLRASAQGGFEVDPTNLSQARVALKRDLDWIAA